MSIRLNKAVKLRAKIDKVFRRNDQLPNNDIALTANCILHSLSNFAGVRIVKFLIQVHQGAKYVQNRNTIGTLIIQGCTNLCF